MLNGDSSDRGQALSLLLRQVCLHHEHQGEQIVIYGESFHVLALYPLIPFYDGIFGRHLRLLLLLQLVVSPL